ncbi:hypothetical protein B5K08_05585 [Rhizobium leguminosarum bv. trifolii]|uniref:Initiator Rep protein domain-containing protein n=1 Tax=Rhizobium leguminosarum bv. trifolii TaxID=386 RepID=A0A3E1BXF5_RHILT|nr:hypothetical protein [Rhizobium leguminosarum]RFB98021.1 hypothetical protein B5K08_05585 [Rhizobium leguminosarum bv. trifolii]RFB99974.1 hypothetical protein B5K10_05575 [Rhizobium leguminosarum bv. trifolii]
MQLPSNIGTRAVPKRKRHKLHGKRGDLFVHVREDGSERAYVWQRAGDDIVRGHQRSGIRCRNLSSEAVYANDASSPRVEIPRIVIDTMTITSNHLRAHDVAAFWRLFAEARKQGINEDIHAIRLGDVVRYLGLDSLQRAKQALVRLASAEMTLRLNQRGYRGQVRMHMLQVLHDTDDMAALRGCDVLYFRLPAAMKAAVLESRDYAWVELNALSRFKSKFTFPLYLKLCLAAGKNELYREVPAMTKTEFRAFVGMPEKTQTSVLDETLQLVCDELLAISGIRKRFPINIAFVDEMLTIKVGRSSKKLRELKPAWIAPKTAAKLLSTVYNMAQEARVNFPPLMHFRQAETAVGLPATKVFDHWSTDIHGAVNYGIGTAGMKAREFLDLIARVGAEQAFEEWVERRHFGFVIDEDGVEQTAAISVPRVLPKPERTTQPTPEQWQSKALTYDDAPLRMIDVIQKAGDDNVNDEKIPF